MQIIKGFNYITQDPDWVKKILIGSIVTAIPVVESISDGYQIQTIKNIRANNPRPLPEWDDASTFFKQGIGLRLIIYAIYIPTFITTVLAIILTFAGILGMFVNDADARYELFIGRFLGWKLFIPILDVIVLTVLPIVFITIPVLSRRLAAGHSVLSLFNPFPTVKLIFSNFGAYVLSRVAVFTIITIAIILSTVVNVLPVIGILASWFIVAVARFWGRLMWAYYLAHMNY